MTADPETTLRVTKLWSGLLLAACVALSHRLTVLTDWKTISRMESDREQAQQYLAEAKSLALRGPILEERLKAMGRELRQKYRDYVAPADSPFPWASAMMTRQATRVGLDLSVLTPLSLRVAPWQGLTADTTPFDLFAVRLDVLADYPQALALIGFIEADSPLLTLTSMSAIETGLDQGRFRATMVWEWPMWKDSPEVREIRALLESAR